LNLLVLTTTFPKSKEDYGTPRFVYDLAYNISNQDIRTIVLTPDRPNSEKMIEEIKSNFIVLRFRYFFKKKQKLTSGEGIIPSIKNSKVNIFLIPFLVLTQFFNTRKIVKKYNIDIVNSHWLVPSGLIGAYIQKRFKKNNYVTVHAAGLYLLEKIPFGKMFAKYIYRNSTKIMVVNNYGKQRIYELLSRPDIKLFDQIVKVIPMGTYLETISDTKRPKNFNPEKFNLLYLGRIVEKKGLKYAIEAMKNLDNNKIQFHICGDGTLKQELEEYVTKNSFNDRVIFYGQISKDEKNNFFNYADALIVPSIETSEGDKEGLPVVILEALAYGLPVIASDVGGISDGVKHMETGLLVKQKNTDEITKAICILMEDKNLVKEFKKKSKEFAKNFEWKLIANYYINEFTAIENEN